MECRHANPHPQRIPCPGSTMGGYPKKRPMMRSSRLKCQTAPWPQLACRLMIVIVSFSADENAKGPNNLVLAKDLQQDHCLMIPLCYADFQTYLFLRESQPGPNCGHHDVSPSPLSSLRGMGHIGIFRCRKASFFLSPFFCGNCNYFYRVSSKTPLFSPTRKSGQKVTRNGWPSNRCTFDSLCFSDILILSLSFHIILLNLSPG